MTPLLDQISLIMTYSAIAVYAAGFIAYSLAFSQAATATTTRARTAVLVSAGAPEPLAEPDQPSFGAPRHEGSGARAGFALACIGFVIELAAVALRGIAAGRVPWANMFEFSLTGTVLIVAVFLGVVRRTRLVFLGSFVLGLVTIVLGLTVVRYYVPVIPLVPALQSAWLVVHVLVALLGTAFFGVAFAASAAQLIALRRESGRALPRRLLRPFGALPDSGTLDQLAYRLNIVGFILWTFTLMAGAIWAGRAWGRYWGWDTKEVWTFVIWVIFAAYLHAKATRGWSGARAAWLSIIGFGAVVFNFAVVNVFFTGLHAYSGLK